MKITISIPDNVFKDLEKYREVNYPHLKKVSRMFLQIVVEKMLNDKR